MMIQTNSGTYVNIENIQESYLPPMEDNYKSTANEYFSRDRPPKPKLDKKYNFREIRKKLEYLGLTIVKTTPYKGNRFCLNTYLVKNKVGNIVICGHLHQIGKWLERKE